MKRQLQGTVVSDKMMKTAVVEVSYEKKHPKYLKYYTISRRFKAHNENNEYKTGDIVTIEETRPLSKDKYFTIVGLIKKAVKADL
jgi:small subunit ribosomal protein S17